MVKTYGSTIKDTPILQLQSWILGGQVVFDPCYGCRLCLGDVMYQISEYRLCPGDVMFQISAGSKSRSPKGDQSLLRRLFGQNWSPFSLLLP